MKRALTIVLSGLTLSLSTMAFAAPRSICLSTGPVDNVAQSPVEYGDPNVEFKLAARFFTMNILNNSRHTVTYEAKVFQIDGLGDFEGGTWPMSKTKIERFYGKREPVQPFGAAILTADLGDDPEESYGYEAQLKITGENLRRNRLLVTGHARKDVNIQIVPEHRITNTEWTVIPCTW